MNPLQIDPWDFDLPEYLLGVSVSPGDLHPNYERVDPRSFDQAYYQDDRHITGAALPLHPLLGSDAQRAVYRLLPWPESMLDWPTGTVFTELGDRPDAAIDLLIQGRARLVATREVGGHEERRVVGQYRTGQWIGLPQLLREFDLAERRWVGWPDLRVRLEVEALGPVRTQRIALVHALSLARACPDFLRFVEHHVAVRFARRHEMMRRLSENPLLRLLSPPDRDYLLQLGAVVEVGDRVADPYLPAGVPSRRAALLLRGEAAVLVPRGDGEGVRYAATLRPGDLVGHEGMVMEAELRDPPATVVDIVEPPRVTEVRLAPGSQVLQFYWYALRWVLDNRAAVWERVKRILSGGRAGVGESLPTIVSFRAARAGLGTTMLACGTGAALAATGRRTVEVIDVQGAENFAARWQPCGFTAEDAPVKLQSGPRMLRAEGRPTEVACRVLVPRPGVGWPAGVRIRWPVAADPDKVEDLVDALETDREVSHIIVAGSDRDRLGLMGHVLDRLRCGSVFYVGDDSGAAYPGTEPENLTWVYRMTPGYLASEQRHAGRVRFGWLYAGVMDGLPGSVRGAIEGVLGYDPSAELDRESVQARRRVVRIPDDPRGAQTFDRGELGELVGEKAQRLPLGRAFARLARVVERRTVGLALGGGGAWGFSHIALLRNLEAHDVPVDYIAGTSFGSVVGGLYAVGGMRALDLLVDANSATGPGIGPTLRALVAGSLNRALLVGPFSSAAVEGFINGQLRAVGPVAAGDPPCLGATEIPFYPVGSNLGTHEPLALPHATAGWGVRMSGSLPPIFPSLLRRYDRIADGAFVGNVPSRVVRAAGAHFVIASNVVPPPPAPTPRSLGRSLVTWLPRKILERLEDTVRGVFVLAWLAGEDQGALAADCTLDLLPTAANLFEMWRGRDIIDEIEAKHFQGNDARRLRDAWDRFRGDGSGPAPS